jgi:hypothetical protein
MKIIKKALLAFIRTKPVSKVILRLARPLRQSPVKETEEVKDSATQRLLEKPSRKLVKLGRRWFVAEVCDGLVPAQLVGRNYEVVTAVLERAGIDYVAVSAMEVWNVQVAIRDQDWIAAVKAITNAADLEASYMRIRDERASGIHHILSQRVSKIIRSINNLEIFIIYTDSVSGKTYGAECSCVLQRWRETEAGEFHSPAPNGTADAVSTEIFLQREFCRHRLGFRVRRLTSAALPDVLEVTAPIDVVYMWVDDKDPTWLQRCNQAKTAQMLFREDEAQQFEFEGSSDPITDEPEGAELFRFRNRNELRYSLRSIEMYAPWVNKIYIVTDNQVPDWLDTNSPRIRIIDHTEIFDDTVLLPVFNSQAIGSRLHHIDSLNEHYIVMNDDIFLNAPVAPEDFFGPGGSVRVKSTRGRRPLRIPEMATNLDWARKNSAELLGQRFGCRYSSYFAHSPIPQIRSIGFDLECEYPEAFAVTASSKFRRASDFEINSWLQLYYLMSIGRASQTDLKYAYFDLGTVGLGDIGSVLFSNSVQIVCLNDGVSELEREPAGGLELILSRYYPRKASFEL